VFIECDIERFAWPVPTAENPNPDWKQPKTTVRVVSNAFVIQGGKPVPRVIVRVIRSIQHYLMQTPTALVTHSWLSVVLACCDVSDVLQALVQPNNSKSIVVVTSCDMEKWMPIPSNKPVSRALVSAFLTYVCLSHAYALL